MDGSSHCHIFYPEPLSMLIWSVSPLLMPMLTYKIMGSDGLQMRPGYGFKKRV